MDQSLQDKISSLRLWLKQHAQLAVAYSGGVDSSLLLRVAAEELGQQCIGILAVSPSLPQTEKDAAIQQAVSFGSRLELIQTQETEDPRYMANAANRCYFCKDHVYRAILHWAKSEGYEYVADGMNADDTFDLRPGRAAAREQGVHSPLHLCGFNKADIRTVARELGLNNWDKPAAACLASRIPYGTKVTPELLGRVEQAEVQLQQLGFKEARVRHHGNIARIEIPDSDFQRAISQSPLLSQKLKQLGYTYVTLDLQGLRHGSMNEALKT